MPNRRRAAAAAAWLAAIPPAMLAGLAPAPAQANDRDPRGTPVPAAACEEYQRSGFTPSAWVVGFWALQGPGKELRLHCPLPLNNVDLSGTTNDNDLSKIRVLYQDSDGFGDGFTLQMGLNKAAISPTGPGGMLVTTVCSWNSDTDGTGATTGATATKACVHDLAATAAYSVDVLLKTKAGASASGTVSFLGIDFPQ
jgi:hypothetical protein